MLPQNAECVIKSHQEATPQGCVLVLVNLVSLFQIAVIVFFFFYFVLNFNL